MTPLAIPRTRRILLIRTDRLGETLLNVPAAAALHVALPQASLVWLVGATVEPLIKLLPCVSETVPYQPAAGSRWPARAWALSGIIRRLACDLAIVSNPMKELHLAVWLARVPVRIGYDHKWGWCLTHRVPDRKALGERHEVEYNLDLVRRLGLPAEARPWQLPRNERDHLAVTRLLAQHGLGERDSLISVHPWTSDPIKQWPLERMQAVMRWIAAHVSAVVVVGGPEEVERAQTVLPMDKRIVNLVGRLTLPQLAALLQRTRLMISNDSGPVHVAAAAGTRTIVLFGTSDPAKGPVRWGPWGPGHVIIWKSSMEAITVDEVCAAIEQAVR